MKAIVIEIPCLHIIKFEEIQLLKFGRLWDKFWKTEKHCTLRLWYNRLNDSHQRFPRRLYSINTDLVILDAPPKLPYVVKAH